MPNGLEQRDYRRYRVQARCQILLAHDPAAYDGFTINLSRTGLLVEVDPPLGMSRAKSGTIVDVRVELPHEAQVPARLLHGRGVVCRLEDSRRSLRLAIRLRGALQMRDHNLRSLRRSAFAEAE